jgi:hypothetical protein
MGLRLTWREAGLCSVAIKAECNPLECLNCHKTDHLYFVRINRSGALLLSIEVFDFVNKTSSAWNSGVSVFQGSNYMQSVPNA